MKFRKFLCFVLIFAIMMSLGVTAFAALSTLAACSHSTLGTQYSDAEHPHKYYRTCKNCNVKVYVGGNATKKHGDGTWGSGTCPKCGTHSYPTLTIDQYIEAVKPHPHRASTKCTCGSVKYYEAIVNPDCSSCIKAHNIKNRSATATEVLYLSYLDGDSGAGIPTVFPVPVKMTQKCQYSKSGSTFTSYTFSINCVFNKNSIPNEATGRTRLVATAQVDYYNNSNSKLFTNTISSTASDPLPTSRSCLEFVKSSIPSYSLAGATGYADGLILPRSVSVRLNYTF